MVPAALVHPSVSAVPVSLGHLSVRYVHVLAAALATGGGALVCAVAASGAGGSTAPAGETATASESTLAAATAYEWMFWGAIAALVATGVGNLGALAPALPRGRWGAVLAGKLALVLAVLAGSALRTLAVCRLRAGGAARPGALRRWYGATTLALGVLVALAEVLAHG